MSQKISYILGTFFLVALAFVIWNNPVAPGSSEQAGRVRSLAAVGANSFSVAALSSEGKSSGTLFTVSCPWVSMAQLQSLAPQLSSCTPAACPGNSIEVGDGGCVVTSLGSNGGSTTPIYTVGHCSRICSK
jgi:hypothetical protein